MGVARDTCCIRTALPDVTKKSRSIAITDLV